MRANRRTVGLLGLAAILMSSTASGAREAPPEIITQNAVKGTSKIPLKIYRNFLVVAEGQFGGSSAPQNFILDTGTAPSIIGQRFVAQLGLKTVPSSLIAAGKLVPTQLARMPEIDIGPVHAFSLLVMVQDLSPLERDFGVPIAGILGLDMLSRASFRLDYEKKDLEFGAPDHEGIPVLVNELTGLAVARVEIEGKPVRLLVDTGSDQIVLLGGNFPHPQVKWLFLRSTSETGASLAEHGMQVQVFAAPEVDVEGRRFRVNRAYYDPASSDPRFDGLLGVRALGFSEVSYDRTSDTIFLR